MSASPTPLFAKRIATLGVAHGSKALPVEGADLVAVEYLYRRGPAYDAGRRDFNNYHRKLTVKMLAGAPETRPRIEAALTQFREKGIVSYTDSLDDPLLKSMVSSYPTRQALLAAGLTEENLDNFAKDHHYVDKRWLREFVGRPEAQQALTAIRKDAAFLKENGLTADDLPKSQVQMKKWIGQGYGAQLLKALVNYHKGPLFKLTRADGTEELAPISAHLQKAIFDRNCEALRDHHGHLGMIGRDESEDLALFLQEKGAQFGMPAEYLNRMAVNHNDQSRRITLKFLRGLQEDHPQVFEAFVQLKAKGKTEVEQKAMQEGNVSIGYKYSQWFMRLLEAKAKVNDKDKATYEKVVQIATRAAVERDLALMEGGKLPIGFNVHHINPLSNGFAEGEMLKKHPALTKALIAQIEAGKPVKGIMDKPSLELVNRLAKLGLLGDTARQSYRYASTFVGHPLEADRLKKWGEFVYKRFTEPQSEWGDNDARDHRIGFLDLQLDPTKKGVAAFSTLDRQFFTKRGMPQFAYTVLAEASIKDGKFDQAVYRREADKICRTLIPTFLAEEKAYQALAKDNIVGGNSTGFYLGQDARFHFNPARGNLLLVNSSAVHPLWNDHSALHIGIDPQSKQRTNAEEIMRLEAARNHAPAEDLEKIDKAIAKVKEASGGADLSAPQPQKVYIPMPRDVILTDPVDRSAWGGAADFRKVFTHPEKYSRETWWLPMERKIRNSVPEDATFGNLTADSYVDKQSLDYQQGFAIGSVYGQIRKGNQQWDQEPPLLPPRYSVDLHAGFRDGEEKGDALPPLIGLSEQQMASLIYYGQKDFRGFDERKPAPFVPPAPFTLRPGQQAVILEHQAMQNAKRAGAAPGAGNGSLEQGGPEPTILPS